MKRLFYMMLICVPVIVLWGCTENGTEDEPTPPISYLEFSEETDISPEFEADGGTSLVEFTSSHDWTASANQSWITLSRKSGTSKKTYFNITVSKNSSSSKRTGTVTITSNSKSYKVSISQKGKIEDSLNNMECAPNEILYKTKYGYAITLNKESGFGGKLVSNTYENGIGRLTFDADVTAIGAEAFNKSTSLIEIKFPNGIKSIGYSAFSGCTLLASITIPNSVTSIGGCAFSGCTSLASITIPDGVTSIGKGAFSDCTSLMAFYGKFASADNRCLIVDGELNSFAIACNATEYIIPNGVFSIGSYVFEDCTSLTSVTIPNSVTSIGSGAFSGCKSLTSITIPNSVTSIGGYAFEDCTSLTSVTIPNSVTSIGIGAFFGCTGELIIDSNALGLYGGQFTKVIIGDSVTSIGYSRFKDCTSLTSVTIGKGVTSIGDGAFSGCTGELIINSKIIEIDYGFGNYPSRDDYDSTGWLAGAKFAELTIGDNITKIGCYTFFNYDSMTSITIPNSVTDIGENAFQDCDSLKSITIPDSVTSIGKHAFEYCSSLTSVTIGKGVIHISDWAFRECDSLESVYCKSNTPPYLSGGDTFGIIGSSFKLYVPFKYVSRYKEDSKWSYYASEIVGYTF